MTAKELLKRIESKSAPVILDPRSEIEFKGGHIPGAINTPVRKIFFKRAQVPQDKGTEIVIGCMHGQRAWLGKKILTMYGYRNITFLEGWLEGWKKSGHPWVK
jgi:rhodanese-related sulfurtransferase